MLKQWSFHLAAASIAAVAFAILLIAQQYVLAKYTAPVKESSSSTATSQDFEQFTTKHEAALWAALERPEAVAKHLGLSAVVPPLTPEHLSQQDKLLVRMGRDKGVYNAHHPRYRLLEALYGFMNYYRRQKEELDRLQGLYKRMPSSQKALLEKTVQYSHRFADVSQLLMSNQYLCLSMIRTAKIWYRVSREELEEHFRDAQAKQRKPDKTSVSQALKHIVRDWAKEGDYERREPFRCVIESLRTTIAGDKSLAAPKILVPGAGLGRLGYDIAAAFPSARVTINEWSMYMNVVNRFIESMSHPHKFYPFVDSWSHHVDVQDQDRLVKFPDIKVESHKVLLVEGDFTTTFTDEAGAYDMLVTYFFIDTARNLVSYLETIHKLLRPGGYWVNLGPLLYGSAPYVQLSLQELVLVIEEMGFEFRETDGEVCGALTWPDRRVRTIKAIYSFDEQALSESAYKAQFWVVQKKE